MEVRNRLRVNKTYIFLGRNLQLFCTKHGIKRLPETPLPLPHRHSITFGREKRQPEIRLLSQTRKEVRNFDFQLIADVLKKGNKFRLSIVGRHIEKGAQFRLSLVSRHIEILKVPNFNFQSEADISKKGTKFRLSIAGRKTQITHVFFLKRNKKVPFPTERVFLTKIEKRYHYLVCYQ